MKLKYFSLIIALVIVFGSSKALLATPLSFSTYSPTRLQILPTTSGVGFSSPSLGNEGSDPIRLGTFDPITGDITGGEAVLIAYLNIGNAPLNRLFLQPGLMVDQTNQINSAIVGSGIVLPANTSPFIGFTLGPETLITPLGSSGTFLVGFALFTSESQSLSEVPGVTIPIDIQIGDKTSFIFPTVKTFSTIGGAQAVIPEPSTLLLLSSGLAGIVFIKRNNLFKKA